MDRKTLLTTLLIGGGTDAGTAIAQLQHAVSVLDETKADKTGTVALADNLTPYSADSGATQDIPFINEATGGGNGESVVDTGSYLQFKKKLGNTVGVNQLRSTISGTGNNSTAYGNIAREQNTDLVYGHYYYVSFDVKDASDNEDTSTYYFKMGHFGYTQYTIVIDSSSNWTHYEKIAKLVDTGTQAYYDGFMKGVGEGKKSIEYKNLVIRDLDRWFGSPDRIPSDLLSHPENWGRYYAGSLAYNAGTLESADGTVMRSIGRNVWKEDHEAGGYDTATGAKIAMTYRGRCATPIQVIPSTAYHVLSPATLNILCYDSNGDYTGTYMSVGTLNTFTTPSNCHYITFFYGSSSSPQSTYGNNVTISLHYSGESGYDQYYPYSVLAEVDTGSEGLRSAGAIADEKTPDGTITRRVGVVDLGTLTWSASSSDTSGYNRFISVETVGVNTPTGAQGNVRCAKYIAITGNDAYSRITGVTLSSGGKVVIYDETLAQGTAAAFKTAMSGIYLYYELATPTTEQGTGFAENIPCDDFGSLIWTQTKGIPQGNEIFYPVDYKASIDTLYNRVDGDMSRIVIDDDLADYNTKTEDESKFATKDALGGTLRQLLATKNELDFDNTAYIDLGNCNYTTNQTGTNTYEAATSFSVPKANGTDNFLCSSIGTKAYADDGKYGIRGYGSSGAVAIRVPISVASTPEGIKAALKGVLLAYEMA